MINKTVKQEAITAEEKNISFEVNLKAENPFINAEPGDMEKIFVNLIGNAIRYGKENGWIKIGSFNKDKSLCIEIKDNGIGIAAEDLENIFQEFYRSQNAKKIVYFGTGLGLSLVKQLIEKYNGSIRAASEEGKGTTFSAVFPQSRSLK